MTTRATNEHPTRRLMTDAVGDYVVELSERTITIRPARARKGGPAEIAVTMKLVYERALMARAPALVRGRG